MSKITITAVLTCLRLAMSFVEKVIRLIYSVIDLVDDGVINYSAPRPDWMSVLAAAINSLEVVLSHLSSVTDEVSLDNSQK